MHRPRHKKCFNKIQRKKNVCGETKENIGKETKHALCGAYTQFVNIYRKIFALVRWILLGNGYW